MIRADLRAGVLLEEVTGVLDLPRRRVARARSETRSPTENGRTGSESAQSTSVGRSSSRSASATRLPSAAPGASGSVGRISGKARAPAFDSGFG